MLAPVGEDAAVAQVVLERGVAAQPGEFLRPQQQVPARIAALADFVELADESGGMRGRVGRDDAAEIPQVGAALELLEFGDGLRP